MLCAYFHVSILCLTFVYIFFPFRGVLKRLNFPAEHFIILYKLAQSIPSAVGHLSTSVRDLRGVIVWHIITEKKGVEDKYRS